MAEVSDSTSPPRSLEEVHGTVPIPASWWKRFLAFSGPALMVSVGYMDPGNWGTDLEAGSKFGYALLWVLLMSNLMALLLQTLATRLGVVSGRDLAQACRESYPRYTGYGLWILAEVAIIATDLAEVIGTIIGLKLLFGVPYLWGLGICALDTFLLLAVQRRGVRLLELITLVLVTIIAGSFLCEIFLVRPVFVDVVKGLLPSSEILHNQEMLLIAIGMLGATVMPHNLYLHSALVQTRAFGSDEVGKRLACKYNFLDSLLSLNAAFFVNSAIVVLSGAAFYYAPQGQREISTLQEAHELLGSSLWGGTVAAVLFAVALLASGQSSTLTGTIAGQVVMEGFLQLRIQPWLRRLITRSLALVPAIIALGLTELSASAANPKASDERLLQMLVFSQVVLSFQLPFAIIPLIQLTGDRRRMGSFAIGGLVRGLAWIIAIIVISLNVLLIVEEIQRFASQVDKSGYSPWWIYGTMGPLAGLIAGFLGWIILYPYLQRRQQLTDVPVAMPELTAVTYRRIGVGVEFSDGDARVLAHATALARTNSATLVIIHVVEGPGATVFGEQTADRESEQDRRDLSRLVNHLQEAGLRVEGLLGYGSPPDELIRVATEQRLDVLILGGHGHRFLADLALGTTVAPVLHRLPIPVLVIPQRG